MHAIKNIGRSFKGQELGDRLRPLRKENSHEFPIRSYVKHVTTGAGPF